MALVAVALGSCSAGDASTEAAFGFNNNAVSQGTATPQQAGELLDGVGAEIDRVQIRWATLEPARGEYDFAPYDAIYRADLARGIRPLFIFAFAPPWAAGDAPCDSRVGNCHVPPSPEHYDDAARTAARIAARYPKAAGIEIWNEPNANYFWAPAADPTAYAKLLTSSYGAIKDAVPLMKVAGGSTSSGSGAESIDAATFLTTVFDEGGAEAMDALSVHAYPEPGDSGGRTAVNQLDGIREVREDAGSTDPIWVTETGVSTTGPDAVSESAQAATVVRTTDLLASVEGVEMVLVHTLISHLGNPMDREVGFGVLGADLRPTTAYCALSSAWEGRARC